MHNDEAHSLACEAAAAWGGCPAPRLIKNRENAVFEVMLPSGRAALRVHRRGYQTEDAIRSELWWMEALADAGLPIPRPLRAGGGALVVRLADGRLASAIDWVDGAPIGAACVPFAGSADEQAALYRRLGRLLADVHATTDRLTLPPAFSRPRWDAAGLLGDAPFWGRFWEHPGLTPEEAGLFTEARLFAQAHLADYAAAGADRGLIHADVLRENVFANGTALSLIDFDDCGFGFRLYDLGTALSQTLEEPALAQIATALADGYSEIRPLGQRERALLPLFTLLRTLASVGWTMPRLAPEHPLNRFYIERASRLADAVLSGTPPFSA